MWCSACYSPLPELTLKREDAVSVVGFLDSGGTWQAVSGTSDVGADWSHQPRLVSACAGAVQQQGDV